MQFRFFMVGNGDLAGTFVADRFRCLYTYCAGLTIRPGRDLRLSSLQLEMQALVDPHRNCRDCHADERAR